jgi:salicylate biosynthesis isochorismate synthase/menaquinone-specific isochorismate synthase
MAMPTRVAESPFALGAAEWERLERRVESAAAVAQGSGERALASVTVAIPADIDVAAAVLGSRRSDDRWFCMEQPDRDGYAVCGLGVAAQVEADGSSRFGAAAAGCRAYAGRTFGDDAGDDPGRPAGSGPVFLGGFAFAHEGGRAPEWGTLAPAQLVMPEVSFARGRGEARMTVTVAVDATDPSADVHRDAATRDRSGVDGRGGGATPARPGADARARDRVLRGALDRARDRVESLWSAPMPLLDPDPVQRARVAGAAPAAHYEEAVQRAVERIRAGDLEKLVLAREVRVHASGAIDPAPILDALRGAFPACYCYCVGTPELALVGASPELLVRRDGERAQTVALAGTTRRSADPAVDDHLGEQLLRSEKDRGEQRIVTERIERALDPVSLWVAAADEPALVKVQNVQHLATPIRAQLAEPIAVLELAGRLHPTPAVGGEPNAAAQPLIPALEGLDRGWYAGAIGWTDLAEDGELCVALRCALLRGDLARLYAGCGIVSDSVPAAELAETEVKLQALLPLLA